MEGVAIRERGTMLAGHPPPDPQNLLRKLTMKNLSKVCLVYPPPPPKVTSKTLVQDPLA